MPSSVRAEPSWVGDFETGDLSQWYLSPHIIGNLAGLTVTDQVVAEGQYAGRVELAPGEISPSGHSRNELVYLPDPTTFEGSERWYSFSLRPGQEQAWDDAWHLVLYWEGNPVYASVLSFVVSGEQVQLRTFVGGETLHWTGPFTPGTWHDYILHVRWSPNPGTGFIELHAEGDVVVPLTNVATMHGPGVLNEMHTGLLRSPSIGVTEVLYIDGVRAGATLEDVMGGVDGGSEGDGGSDEGPGGPGEDDTTGEDGGGTDGGGTGGTDGGAATDDGLDDDAGDGETNGAPGGTGSVGGETETAGGASDGGDGGCGCRSSGAPPRWWLWVPLLAWARRRRAKEPGRLG